MKSLKFAMKAPIRQIIEALDGYLHFLPDAGVRQGREHHWLQASEVAEQLRHYGSWVNFWGVCCGLVALLVPGLMLLQVSISPHQLPVSTVSVIRFILCFPAVMLAVKFAGDLFICAAANLVQRLAPGVGCTHRPQHWSFRELRSAYAWYCGVPRYWVRRANRMLFLMAALGVCTACYLG